MTFGTRHWVSAISVALLAHASLLLVFREPARSGAASLGVGGVNVAFGMAGGSPGAREVPPPETAPLDVPETPVVEAEPEPVQELVEETEVAEVVPVVEETAAVVEIRPQMQQAIPPKKPNPTELLEVEPTPQPPLVTRTEVAATAPPTEAKAAPPSLTGAAGRSGTQQSANIGAGSDAWAGGHPGSSKNYFTLLQAWLEKNKQYPLQARRRRLEGTAMLTFTIDRRGRVLAARITRSAGEALLDEEVMKMIRRADPVPPFPDDFAQTEIKLVVPVQFQLR